jgi:hypothetical protein
MAREEQQIPAILRDPDIVVEPESGSGVLVYHRRFERPDGEQRYMRVVVKCNDTDCFLLTAHIARGVKLGIVTWTKK